MVKEKGAVADHLEAEVKTKRKMKMQVLAKTRGMTVSTTTMIKTLEIKEEEVEDIEKVLEEEAFMVPIFIAMEKVIVLMNSLKAKEG